MWCVQDTEEALMANLRDSHILNHKQNLEWNWLLIATILKVSLYHVSDVAVDGKKAFRCIWCGASDDLL